MLKLSIDQIITSLRRARLYNGKYGYSDAEWPTKSNRIKYSMTYPGNWVIIESVNGIRNQVLAAKYHHILSTGSLDDIKRNLLHKDDMTQYQLEWLEQDD